jgi:hypothetical protein
MQTATISSEAGKLLKTMKLDVRSAFEEAVKAFTEQLSQTESLHLILWCGDLIYFQVIDSRFINYPENISALISFDTANGEFYSGQTKHKVAWRGWGEFLGEYEALALA